MSCRLLSRHSVRTSWEFSLEGAGISPTYQDWLLRSHPIFDRKVGINITAPCTLESKNKFGSKCDAFGADVSSRMYVYSPYTICLRNWLTQACATKGFAYAGLLWHDSFNSHQGRLWKMLMPPERLKVTQLMSTWPHVQEARERFKKISLGDFVWCVVFLQSSE